MISKVTGCQYWRRVLLEEPNECHWSIMSVNPPFIFKATLKFWKSFDIQTLLLQQLGVLHRYV